MYVVVFLVIFLFVSLLLLCDFFFFFFGGGRGVGRWNLLKHGIYLTAVLSMQEPTQGLVTGDCSGVIMLKTHA